MTKYIDIIDTVIKIGLGALISGVTSYYTTLKSHTHEDNKDYIKYKRDILIKIANEIDKAGSKKNNVKYIVSQDYNNNNKSNYISLECFPKCLNELHEACDIIKNAVTYSYLIGDKSLADLIKNYFHAMNSFSSLFADNKNINYDDYNKKSEECNNIKLQILEQYSISLNMIYKK